jgi:hypothetical protein
MNWTMFPADGSNTVFFVCPSDWELEAVVLEARNSRRHSTTVSLLETEGACSSAICCGVVRPNLNRLNQASSWSPGTSRMAASSNKENGNALDSLTSRRVRGRR